ncbi:MAG: TetR family transcriptional regulator C-terminal domain-containing protein [Pseudomonadota bacterium]
MSSSAPKTRIQEKNRRVILDAALDVFSKSGFRGATLDQVARSAGLSKPNLLYYFASKDEIYTTLLSDLLDTWLDPLRAIDAEGDPVEEIVGYVLRKLQISRKFPRESLLFANEIFAGAPNILPTITGPLKALVDDKADLVRAWSRAGRLAPVDPHHLIFSIWATTQHYADFDTQIRGILGQDRTRDAAHFTDAAAFLEQLYRGALTPQAS